jgi:hypothetical protein
MRLRFSQQQFRDALYIVVQIETGTSAELDNTSLGLAHEVLTNVPKPTTLGENEGATTRHVASLQVWTRPG